MNTIPSPSKNGLSPFGYSTKVPVEKRKGALAKAVINKGYAYVVRRLTLLINLNQNQNPRAAKVMTSDRTWVQKNLVGLSKTYQRNRGGSAKGVACS